MSTRNPRFKLDENLPSAAQRMLRGDGYDVETVLTEHLGGALNSAVFATCQIERRVLVTLDLDFADIRSYSPTSHCGIRLLRPPRQTVDGIVEVLRGALALLATETPDRCLWIVEKDRVRVRQ